MDMNAAQLELDSSRRADSESEQQRSGSTQWGAYAP